MPNVVDAIRDNAAEGLMLIFWMTTNTGNVMRNTLNVLNNHAKEVCWGAYCAAITKEMKVVNTPTMKEGMHIRRVFRQLHCRG